MSNLKDLLKIAGVAALSAVLASLLVLSLVGNQSDSKPPVNSEEDLGRGTEFSQVCTNDVCRFSKRLLLDAGEQFEAVQNTTGSELLINLDDVIVRKVSTVATSSSFVAFVGTSSAATLTGGNGLSVMEGGGIYASSTHKVGSLGLENLPFGGIIDNLIFGTSTMQESFSSSSLATDHIIGLGNRNENNRDASSTVISLQPQEYIWFLLVTGDAEDPAQMGCNTSVTGDSEENNCESATSTNRGGNFEVWFDNIATSTRHN